MAREIMPERVLSTALQTEIGQGHVLAAVFFTFNFDPGFFEEHILPLLFDEAFSHVRKIRLHQLRERLLELEELAVYYDPRGLSVDAEPATLDYARLGLMPPAGFFHPKNVFVLVRDGHEPDAGNERLVLLTASANLKQSGWWENVETAHVEAFIAGKPSAHREELLDLFDGVRKLDATGDEHHALGRIEKFLHALPRSSRRHGKTYFYSGREELPEFLRRNVGREWNLEIISPYFDHAVKDGAPGGALGKLLGALRPAETRVYLPCDMDGRVGCEAPFFAAVEAQPHVHWGRLPDNLLARGPGKRRYVHAKVYRLWREGEEWIFAGSANLTGAGHSGTNNIETGILVRYAGPRDGWLLTVDKTRPAAFTGETEGEEDSKSPYHVVLRFNWQTGEVHYFWEPKLPDPPVAKVTAAGSAAFVIEPIVLKDWTPVPDAGTMVRDRLQSSSFLEVTVDGITFPVLVREEGMEHRPPILPLQLTPEEILRYWSLLTPEQRQALLESKAASPDVTDPFALAAEAHSPMNSMFDRFAGIFHAFGRLEATVRAALEAAPRREKEANYRLFGNGIDSLPALVGKFPAVVNQANGGTDRRDPVPDYLMLLCARQLLWKIKTNFRDFLPGERAKLARSLEAQIKAAETRFDFDTAAQRRAFFDWFRESFFEDAGKSARMEAST